METVQELKPVELSRIAQINKTTLNRILQKEQDQLSVINNRIRGISPELVEEILKEKRKIYEAKKKAKLLEAKLENKL